MKRKYTKKVWLGRYLKGFCIDSFLKRGQRLFLSPLYFLLNNPALGIEVTPLKSFLAHILALFLSVSITLDFQVLPYQLDPD